MADWVRELIAQGGYVAIFLLMFAETVFPPIPSEVIMSLAGFEAARGTMSLPLAILTGTAGAMAGNYVWYRAARALGIARLKPLVDRHGRWFTASWADIERGAVWFRRYGAWFVGLGRLMPSCRSLMSIPAGLVRMQLGTFLFWSSIGTAVWTAILATFGWQLGTRFAQAEQWLNIGAVILVAPMALWYVWRVARWKPVQSE